ncbi:MAG: DNA topoisomerase I [Actinomycetia bacterium]|nr:DNA topoisomerase I [Actinomycetes bacterium]
MKLIISEKEIAARRMADILSGGKAKEEKVYGIPTYLFGLDGQNYRTIGLKGHILKVDFPKKYANWFKVDPMDLIDAEIEKMPIQKKIIQALKKSAKEVDQIIVATDYDREGELIGYDALTLAQEVNGEADSRRAKFSSITPRELSSSFGKLDRVDLNLAFAGRARQDIDLIWGATLTRFISLASYQVKDKFLSVGRVQTPTLTLIVDREEQIKRFKPVPYWVIKVLLSTEDGQEFEAGHRQKRFSKREKAEAAYNRMGSQGEVTQIKERQKKIKPPIPFNTTGLIVAASSLGFTANRTISTAENLYMNGYISYPRTDNTVFPSSIDLAEVTREIGKSSYFKSACSHILAQDKVTATRGRKRSTDHPPIYPTLPAEKNSLSSDEWKIYELVVSRFLATLMPPAVMKSISARIDIGGETFVANGSHLIEKGWVDVYPYYKHKDSFIPHLEEGQILTVKNKHMLDKETKPPARYTQGKLVEKMEELGLGTKATRHTIIQSLISRGYIKGNPLEPYEKAISVIKMLKKHAEKISSPDMTAELEMDMDGIAAGDETREEVVDKSREMLKKVMARLKNEKEEIAKEIKNGVKEDLKVGKCTQDDCDGDLIIRTSRNKKRFIGCSAYPQCRNTFSLPQKGLILTTKDKCKECGFPIVKVINRGRRPWNLCINPQCPAKDEKYKNYNRKKAGRKADS